MYNILAVLGVVIGNNFAATNIAIGCGTKVDLVPAVANSPHGSNKGQLKNVALAASARALLSCIACESFRQQNSLPNKLRR